MSFVTLHTGLSGLRASQTAVDTTSNNIANVDTPGYTRQRVELSPRIPYDSPAGQVGTGVEVDRIVRLRDSFLDARVRSTTAAFAASDTRDELLVEARDINLEEAIMNLQVEEVAYEATLAAIDRVLPGSLVSFLR